MWNNRVVITRLRTFWLKRGRQCVNKARMGYMHGNSESGELIKED